MSKLKKADEKECCCGDHVGAARAGHIECLQRLQEKGGFLGLGGPDQERAGHARKAQAWEAAHAACGAGHGFVLTWLFDAGWPPAGDAVPQLYLRTAEDWSFSWDADLGLLDAGLVPSQYEYLLYRSAVQSPTPACLEALLDAGCKSPLLCTIAAEQGNEAYLELAARRGCPCGLWAMWAAARAGSRACLELAWRMWRQSEQVFKRQKGLTEKEEVLLAVEAAASHGHVDCLELLCNRFGEDYAADMEQSAVMFAAWTGQTESLRAIHRRGIVKQGSWEYSACCAARQGHLGCLEILLEKFPEFLLEPSARPSLEQALSGIGLSRALLYSAAEGRRMEALQFLHDAGCRWRGDEAWGAVGDPEVLSFCL
eukprot:jgi/Botrbrau1/9041/Bobra.0376s0018.1